MSTDQETSGQAVDPSMTPEAAIEEAVEQAKRAYALKNFEQAVDHYASALELKTKIYGDASPECVDLYFSYGKALLENAIAQNSVLGKEETPTVLEDDIADNKASGSTKNVPDARIHFGEDDTIEEEDNDMISTIGTSHQEQTIDLFADAIEAEAEQNGRSKDDISGDGELEDDFNAAWDVLEVARALYETQKDSGDEVELKLADTYIALGDVSLETEKLDQAATDYTAAVKLKEALLPLSSRQIAEVHYKLCIVYDMTAGRLAHAIEHAKRAEASVRARLNEITTRLQSAPMDDVDTKGKGKGKAVPTRFATDKRVEDMTKSQLESEIKELEGLLEDVLLKIEELKSSPERVEMSAPDLAAQELDQDLNGSSASKSQTGIVNDLTSMVVKKKKRSPEDVGDKRKAEEDTTASPEKKMKLDEATV